MLCYFVLLGGGLGLCLLSSPAWAIPPSDAASSPERVAKKEDNPTTWVEEEERRKKEAWSNKGWWGAIGADVHLAFADRDLRETSGAVGSGLTVSAGFGLQNVPLLLGFHLGFDGFWPRVERFVYEDRDTYWDIKRHSVWLLPSIRLMPSDEKFRPYLGFLGGLWIHNVTLDPENALDDKRYSLGADTVGAYGLTAGFAVTMGNAGIGLGVKYLRGGGIKVPNEDDIWVEDGRLNFSEERSGAIHEWLVSLELTGFL